MPTGDPRDFANYYQVNPKYKASPPYYTGDYSGDPATNQPSLLPIKGFEKIDLDRYMADHPELTVKSLPPVYSTTTDGINDFVFKKVIPKTLRTEVYAAIDGERDYQDSKWKGPDHDHEVGSYITMLTSYVRQVQDEWTMKSGDYAALHIIRKIAAIAVHCMEDHGAPKRGEVINQDGEKIQTAN